MAGNVGVVKVIQRNEDLDQAASSRQHARSAVASSARWAWEPKGQVGMAQVLVQAADVYL